MISSDHVGAAILKQVIERIRLPPNLQIKYTGQPLDWEGRHDLLVTGYWPDVNDPKKTITTYVQLCIDARDLDLPGSTIAKLILLRVKEIWLHELYEWFTYDGEHVEEPHPERVK